MRKTLLHLSLIPGVGPATILKLLEVKELASLYTTTVKELQALTNSEKQGKIVFFGLRDKKLLETELGLIKKHRVKLVTILDDSYPQQLREIYLPPPVLYFWGELSKKDPALSIVGSRKGNDYAKKVCQEFVPKLVAHGITIVSGGALGVDGFAHEAAVNAGGKTVVVLGSGLLKIYPQENKGLFQAVVRKGGALVSPFPLMSDPLKGNFPARNRIIAGLSGGCLVVQAAKRSGASITARFALEQGREVFAVPGNVFDELSVGCHELVQEGAKLVQDIDDIMEEFL